MKTTLRRLTTRLAAQLPGAIEVTMTRSELAGIVAALKAQAPMSPLARELEEGLK